MMYIFLAGKYKQKGWLSMSDILGATILSLIPFSFILFFVSLVSSGTLDEPLIGSIESDGSEELSNGSSAE